MAELTHVIRLHSAGASQRWVRSIGRTDAMGCTVTWSAEQARHFTAELALRQAARLQDLLGTEGITYVAEPVPAAMACAPRADACAVQP